MAEIEGAAPCPLRAAGAPGSGVPQLAGAPETTDEPDELIEGIAMVLMAMRDGDAAAGALDAAIDPEPADAATRRLLCELDRLWRAAG